jgi:hypothetical protein
MTPGSSFFRFASRRTHASFRVDTSCLLCRSIGVLCCRVGLTMVGSVVLSLSLSLVVISGAFITTCSQPLMFAALRCRPSRASLSISLPSLYFYPYLLSLLTILMCLLPQELMRTGPRPSSSSLRSNGTLSERLSSRLEIWLAMTRINHEPGANAHMAIRTHHK